jgi:hypothetical protein
VRRHHLAGTRLAQSPDVIDDVGAGIQHACITSGL